uniref:HTH TFE/IIEalpha-type domain-containing protein n=1 Tax=Setaria digitata TaxID=48799 RepID=A0A915PU40_9BILA
MDHHNHHTDDDISNIATHSMHDHHDHSGMSHVHPMTFHFGSSEVVLFSFWVVTSPIGIATTCAITVVMSFIMESIRWFRGIRPPHNVDLHTEQSCVASIKFAPCITTAVCTDAILHAIQLTLSYVLMLLFMTFNVWICTATVLVLAIKLTGKREANGFLLAKVYPIPGLAAVNLLIDHDAHIEVIEEKSGGMSLENDSNDQRRNEEHREMILEELPENLIRFASLMVKTFYGKEHYIVLNYVQRNKCIREDDLRQLIKFDQRFLRTVLMQLKVDKILKERLVSEETDGRARKVNYYFINYKALLNVAKYKIDHMRQRLEVKDKDEVHKASYRCTGCQYQYDAMEMDKIFDPLTQELCCWRCQHTVEPDETAGPTDETRQTFPFVQSSLARFNEQMAPFFSMLQSLYGIRLARHLVEPSIKVVDNVFMESEAKRVAAVGERPFSEQTAASRSTMYHNSIMVSIVEESVTPNVEPKKLVPWLHSSQKDEQVMNSFAISSDNSGDLNENMSSERNKNDIDSLLVTEFEEVKPETSNGSGQGAAYEPISIESDDEEVIFVAGMKYYLDEVTPELVSQMNSSEKEIYIKRTQENFDY